jgi:hypothetical protein
MSAVSRLVAALAACSALACTPTLDWREVRPAGSRAQLMFPCKPASHARQVTLAGASVEMSMYACSAGEATYAIAFADMVAPTHVTPALEELAHAARDHLLPTAPPSSAPIRVQGMTPNDRAARWQIVGRLPDGRTLQEQAAFFAYGTRVYQATVVGERLDAEALETFFGALRVGG